MKKKQKNYYAEHFKNSRKFWAYRSPAKKDLINKATYKDENGLQKIKCNNCFLGYAKSDIQVDHIIPCGPEPKNIEEFHACFDRLESHNLQILCKPCHKNKTKADVRKIRMNYCLEKINDALDFFGYVKLTNRQFDDICKLKVKQITILLDKMRCEDEHFVKNQQKLVKILDNI